MNKYCTAGIAVALASLAGTANAIVVDFDTQTSLHYASTYVEHGFAFSNTSSSSSALLFWGSNYFYSADRNGGTLGNNYADTTTTIVRTDGARFGLASVDLTDGYNTGRAVAGSTGGNILFTFRTPWRTTTEIVTLDTIRGLQTVAIGRNNLVSVSFRPLSTFARLAQTDNFVFENITMNSSAPEPAAWAMMVVGFGLVGSAVRRRARIAATA